MASPYDLYNMMVKGGFRGEATSNPGSTNSINTNEMNRFSALGKIDTLEDQLRKSMINPNNMANNIATSKISNRQPGIRTANERPITGSTNITGANNQPPNAKNNLMNLIMSPAGSGAAKGLLKAGAYSPTPISNAEALSMMMQGIDTETEKARKAKMEQATFDLNKKLTDSQIYKNYNPVVQKSNIAKMMSESFPLLKPGTPEYQEEFNKMLNKSQQIINMNANAMNEGAKTMATEHAKEVIATNKTVQDNYELTSRLNTMENLVDDPDFESGPMTEATLPLRRLLSEAGFLTTDATEKITKQELFQAYANYLVPRMRVAGSGSTSNFEAELFATATAGLGKNPFSNRVLVKSMKAMQEHMKLTAAEKEKYYYRLDADGNKSYNLEGFTEHMNGVLEENPIFKKYATDDDLYNAWSDKKIKKNDLFYDMEQGAFKIVDDAMINNLKEYKPEN
jgi:hypothetical protein